MRCGRARSGHGRSPSRRTLPGRRRGCSVVAVPQAPAVHREADARRERELAARTITGVGQPLEHAAGNVLRRRLAGALDEHRELVAAEARERVAGTGDVGRRRPTSASSSSPTSWPRLSLTCLKPSRSSRMTESSARDRSERASACSTRSRKSARFARPVRLSWNACRISSSSSATRSVTSRALSTTPRMCLSRRRSVTCASRCRHSSKRFGDPEDDLGGLAVAWTASQRQHGRRDGRSRSKPSPSSSSSERPSIRSTDPLT